MNLVWTYLQVGTEIFGYERRLALTENHDFLLDVFDLVLCLLQVNDFDCNNAAITIVNAFEHFTETAESDALLARINEFGINFLNMELYLSKSLTSLERPTTSAQRDKEKNLTTAR